MIKHRSAGFFLIIFFLFGFAISSCGGQNSESVRVVQDYLTAMAAQDQIAISNLTCSEWETQAFLEMDALQLVRASLKDIKCREAEAVSGGVIVTCSGKMETTYNNEISTVDLSQNRYFVSHENGDWLECGYQ